MSEQDKPTPTMWSEGVKRPLSHEIVERAASIVKRAADGVQFVITGVEPAGWFSPGQPIQPVKQESKGRVWDYPVGYNLRYTPKGDDTNQSPFEALRFLASSEPMTAAVIETRKDQLAKVAWDIVAYEPGEEPKGVGEIKAFLERPDKELDFKQWQAALVHEMLVTDAATVYIRRDEGGKLYSADLMDGTLLKPLIDSDGRKPLPPNPSFIQNIKGVPANFLNSDEVIYARRVVRVHTPYGYSPVEQIQFYLNLALRREVSQLQAYTEGNVPEALVQVPNSWTPDQIREFEAHFNAKLAGNTAERRRIQFIPGGAEGAEGKASVLFTKQDLLKDSFDEWLARVICFAFSIPPTPFVAQMNRATAESSQKSALEEGLYPMMAWFEGLMNRLLAQAFERPDLRFKFQIKPPEDPLKLANAEDLRVKNGTASIDELRAERGLAPIGANRHLIYGPMGATPVVLGEDYDPVPDPPEPPPTDPGKAPAIPSKPPKPETGASAPTPSEEAPQNPPVPAPEKTPEAEKAAGGKRQVGMTEKPGPEVHAHLKKATETALKAQGKKVGKAVARLYAKAQGEKALTLEKGGTVISKTPVDLSTMKPLYGKASKEEAKRSGNLALAKTTVSTKGMVDLVNARATSWSDERAAWLVTRLEETTRAELRGTISEAVEQGWSPDQLASAIEDSYAFSPARSEMISRTELAYAHSQGNFIGWKASGVVTGKQWLLGSGHVNQDECDDNADAGVIGLEEDFPSGDDMPPQHPNCICAVVAVCDEVGDEEATVEGEPGDAVAGGEV